MQVWLRLGVGKTLLVGLGAAAILAAVLIVRPIRALGQTYYVSLNGNNGDGRSWETAWNELNQINWGIIGPGDTILIDGGPNACPSLGPGYDCGMVYNSTLSVGASGTESAPITIQLASEPGRNGAVIIDGGVTAWPQCAEYADEPVPPSAPNGKGTRDTGIKLNNAQWIFIDGTKWGGIEVRNHTVYGVNIGAAYAVYMRYLKVHHNTNPTNPVNAAVGVTQGYKSSYVTVGLSEIFRNGQDAVRVAGDYFTLERSYLHDQYCNHPDGIQSFVPTNNNDIPDDAGEVRGLTVRRNVFERIGLQAIFLGENAAHNSWNVDVVIHDNLFLDGAYMIKSKNGNSRNWNIHNNTFMNVGELAVEWCCANPGARTPMQVTNNVFVNVNPGKNGFYLPTADGNTEFSGNCLYNTGRVSGNISQSGTVEANPLFANVEADNYDLLPGSPCAGKGSSINAVADIVGAVSAARSAPPGPYAVYFPVAAFFTP